MKQLADMRKTNKLNRINFFSVKNRSSSIVLPGASVRRCGEKRIYTGVELEEREHEQLIILQSLFPIPGHDQTDAVWMSSKHTRMTKNKTKVKMLEYHRNTIYCTYRNVMG